MEAVTPETLTLLLAFLTLLGAQLGSTFMLLARMNDQNKRIDAVNARFDTMNQRFDETTQLIGELRDRTGKVEGRLEGFLAGRGDRNAA
ncbi:MAG: hypothetical protein OXG72_02125 [Acidobacteria bacterium]|nr:hypothetical protein [Acidobacteriota bacterium]